MSWGRFTGACLVAAALLCNEPAMSAPSGADRSAAEALYKQAKELFDKADYEQACKKFDASQKLDAAVGTLLFLGDCYEKRAMSASAKAAFDRAVELAVKAKDKREKIAAVRAAALKPQVSSLEVRLPEALQTLPGLVITRGGVEIPKSNYGVALPLDAGVYTIAASAPGRTSWSAQVTVKDGGETMVVDVQLAEPPVVKPVIVAPPPPPAPPPEKPSNPGPALRIGGLITLGVGIAGGVIGGIFGAQAKAKYNQSLAHCRTDQFCNDEGVSLRDAAKMRAGVATGAFIAGGVLAAGGIIMLVLAPRLTPKRAGEGAGLARLEIAPSAAPGFAGVSLGGAW